ncbi:hypothetical protein NLX67_03100 [Domibacillus sp. A3M-37]|uniref:hypothetical protein n=1 Tax=Domibacillus sp. A3M-37 TaxID=2962037 RepID=UPI0020B8001A|nr:hypothetical protein [Domibacillus sp. A3M-37]MCP3761377.1 hypothetical protein [Domibacillus sp. A3M-37]
MQRRDLKYIFIYLMVLFIDFSYLMYLLFAEFRESIFIFIVFSWIFFLLIQILIFKGAGKYFSIITVFITLYSVSAYIASNWGFIYFDIPKFIIDDVTLKSLAAIIFSHFILFIISPMFKNKSLKDSEQLFIKRIKTLSINKINLMLFLMFLIGSYFWYRLIFKVGLPNLIGNPRFFASVLLEQAGFYHQIIMIPISIILTAYLINNKLNFKRKFLFISILLLAWIPLLLVGARKEIYVYLLAILFFGGIKKSNKIIMGFFTAIVMLIIPLVREGWSGFENVILSFQEFILPQYSHFIFELLGEQQKSALLNLSGYEVGAWSLFPGFLRVEEFIPLGLSVFNLGLTNVGIAAHPIGEAFLNFGTNGYIIFVFIFVFLNIFTIRLAKNNIMAFVICFLYLILLGRTDLWVTVFFCLYTYIFIAIFFIKFKYKETQ